MRKPCAVQLLWLVIQRGQERGEGANNMPSGSGRGRTRSLCLFAGIWAVGGRRGWTALSVDVPRARVGAVVCASTSVNADNESTWRMPIVCPTKSALHHAGRPHPERPERVASVLSKLRGDRELSGKVEIREPTWEAARTLEEIEKVHYKDHIDIVRSTSERGGGILDQDTYANEATYDVAVSAAGAWLDAVDTTLASGKPTFALTRPPGHHATSAGAMGFCIFSNAAIAASYAITRCGLGHVAILDWDVHHGNGTQGWVRNHPQVRMTSSHQWPFYPGTGEETFTGPHGNVRNIALPAGTTWTEYKPRYENEMLPFVTGQGQEGLESPELVIISAGYDALQVDHLAQVDLLPEHFGLMTESLLASLGHTKIVLGLEGGYHLDGVRATTSTPRGTVGRGGAEEDPLTSRPMGINLLP